MLQPQDDVSVSKTSRGWNVEICNRIFFFSWDKNPIYFYYLKYLFVFVLGLHCFTRAFSSHSEWGLRLVAVHGFLVAVASLVAESGSGVVLGFSRCSMQALLWLSLERRLSSCGAHPSIACGIFLDQGLNPGSIALAGKFLSIGSPGKPPNVSFKRWLVVEKRLPFWRWQFFCFSRYVDLIASLRAGFFILRKLQTTETMKTAFS